MMARCRNNIFIILIKLIDDIHLNQDFFHLQNQQCVWSQATPPFSYVYLIHTSSLTDLILKLLLLPSVFTCDRAFYLLWGVFVDHLFLFLLDFFSSLSCWRSSSSMFSSFSVSSSSSSFSPIHTWTFMATIPSSKGILPKISSIYCSCPAYGMAVKCGNLFIIEICVHFFSPTQQSFTRISSLNNHSESIDWFLLISWEYKATRWELINRSRRESFDVSFKEKWGNYWRIYHRQFCENIKRLSFKVCEHFRSL